MSCNVGEVKEKLENELCSANITGACGFTEKITNDEVVSDFV